MKRLIIGAAIILLSSSAYWARTSAQTKPDIGLRTLDLKEPERELGLIWHTVIVPGEEVVIVKITFMRYGSTFFGRYRFAGVVGNSLKIEKTGASQSKGETRAEASKSLEQTLYIERATDGAFYFVPEDAKDIGVFRIRRDEVEPGRYSVTFDRRAK